MGDVSVAELSGFGLATVLPRRAVTVQALGAALGMALQTGPRTSIGSDMALIGISPQSWLAFAEQAGDDWAEALDVRLGEAGDAVDQSGGYRLFALTGAGARAKLQAGLPIDLDPSVLATDAVLVSQIAHIGVVVWQRDGAWIVAVPRSFAADLHDWLAAA